MRLCTSRLPFLSCADLCSSKREGGWSTSQLSPSDDAKCSSAKLPLLGTENTIPSMEAHFFNLETDAS